MYIYIYTYICIYTYIYIYMYVMYLCVHFEAIAIPQHLPTPPGYPWNLPPVARNSHPLRLARCHSAAPRGY